MSRQPEALGRALSRLYALAPRGARYGVSALAEAAAREGHPELTLPTVHIAGTNGKGSVAASIESIAREAGLLVGLYTSPHLVKFAERIRIDGAPIDDDELATLLDSALDAHPSLTFFEIATLVAWKAFVRANIELAVMEVGLGGRLDATNLVERPLVTAITSIGIDHAELLGSSIEAIAGEKAGIVKRDAPLVLGRMPIAARETIESIAADRGAGPVWSVGREIEVHAHDDGSVVVEGPEHRRVSVRPKLSGPHQRDNAAVAVAIAWLLRERDSIGARLAGDDVLRDGLAKVWWPGRCEVIESKQTGLAGAYLLDGAHNEDGALSLAATLAEGDSSHDRAPADERVLVFGVMGDKPWTAMLDALRTHFGHAVIVAPHADGGGRRAADPNEIARAWPGAEVAIDASDALTRARQRAGMSGLVVVAGSLYLVGEARARLLGLARDPHVGL